MRVVAGCLRALRALAAVAALAATAAARPDVVFRAPEVLVRHAAISKPVGTRAANIAPGGGGTGGAGGGDDWPGEVLRYEEFFIEHDVSTADAKKAADALNVTQVREFGPGCGVACSRWELEYCESRIIGDHCCCERRPFPEPFPYLPHSCYAGAAACRPRAANCVAYTRIRDCCCARRLAEKWKGILSSAGRTWPPLLTPTWLLAVLLAAAPAPQ